MQPAPTTASPLKVIPERYVVREKDGVRSLSCDEAPRVRAVVDPDMAASKSEAAALGDGVILLDGAGTFGPVLDNEKKIYNLDHHWGCERLFTLSTCEQALLLVHSGLGLADGDWTLYANDPDLDTVLALWCLLNHRRLRELRPEARDILLPLLRLEGAIDSNGRELAQLCGLPSDVMKATEERIEALLVTERRLKQEGRWTKKDPYSYTLEMLRTVDALVYREEDFGDYTRVEEIYGHVEVAPRKVAVVCRDRSGIYTVEQLLKTHWGDQLALVALENQPGQYTLRRVSSIGGPGLEDAYDMLNRMDPAVDGRPPGKRWGGSRDIGGSPRPRGTLLASAEVLEGLKRAYRPRGARRRLASTATALAVGAFFWILLGPLTALLPSWLPVAGEAMAAAVQRGEGALLAFVAAALATRAITRSRWWMLGWRSAATGGWWLLAPVVLLLAIPVRGLLPVPLGDAPLELAAGLAAAAGTAAAAELWFRGVVHGMLSLEHRVQHPGGPFFVSRAAWVSALAWAAVAAALTGGSWGGPDAMLLAEGRLQAMAVAGGSALLAGLALASVRERSLSVWPCVLLQVAGVLLAGGLWSWASM